MLETYAKFSKFFGLSNNPLISQLISAGFLVAGRCFVCHLFSKLWTFSAGKLNHEIMSSLTKQIEPWVRLPAKIKSELSIEIVMDKWSEARVCIGPHISDSNIRRAITSAHNSVGDLFMYCAVYWIINLFRVYIPLRSLKSPIPISSYYE